MDSTPKSNKFCKNKTNDVCSRCCSKPSDYIYSILDMGDRGYPEPTVNLFKTEEAYRKYLIDLLKDSETDMENFDDMTTDDLECEIEEMVREGEIDGSFHFLTKSNIIDRE